MVIETIFFVFTDQAILAVIYIIKNCSNGEYVSIFPLLVAPKLLLEFVRNLVLETSGPH